MWITDFSLRHRATVYFMMVLLIVAGLVAWTTLPRESSPDIPIPVIIVYTLYPGASPADVESQITRPVERELKGVEGLKELTSVSQESASVVTAEFVSGTDIDDALQKVRDRVDRAEVDFPTDAEDPVLQEINFSDIPILQVNLSGEVGPVALKNLAEDLQDELEALPGVLRVNLIGGIEREVQVHVDPERLQLFGLSLDDVIDAVRDENVSIPGGDLKLGDSKYAVRVPGEVGDPLEVGSFVIKARAGAPVFVRDVAEVKFGLEDRTSYARIDGEESVALAVQKRTGANIIEVADAVKEIVGEVEGRWPTGVKATLLGDQSKDIRQMVTDLENNILSGLILVVLVLMFAMGFRNSLFVGFAIPMSMLLTFVVLQSSGTTLNMVVLFAMILSVGMLVDNGIVVVENIYRHMQEGKSRDQAASDATREVGSAIVASTLTTVGAFSPLLFWPGIVGEFMFFLPMTTSIALAASLVVAFTLNPVLCASFMKVPPPGTVAPAPGRLGRVLDAFGRRIARSYEWSLGFALDHRWLVVAGTFAAFLGVFVLFGMFNHGVEFFPETEPTQIIVDVEMSAGTRLERTDEVLREFERRLMGIPDLEILAAGAGAGSQSEFGSGGGEGGDTHKARINLDLYDRKDREQNSFKTMEQVRGLTAGLPGVTVDVDRPAEGPPVGDPLSIEISGDDFAALGRIAARAKEAISDVPGLVSLADDFDLARPEVVVQVDRTQAARLGLTTAKIARTVRTAVTGTEASTYRYGEDEADIRVRLDERFRTSLEDLARLTIVTEDGAQVPLSSVATIARASALTSITHKDQKRVVTISGKVTSPELAEPVRQESKRRLEAIPDLLPQGYRMEFAGASQDEEEAQAFLTKAFLYALLIVLGLIVAQFNSLAPPLIIMTSVIMSMIGVLLGLLVTGLPFGIIMTGLGVISLAGIVVNNAIVLLDYGEQLRARGGLSRRELVMTVGQRRMRPVLLTAVTTILGLIPLTTGVDFNFRALEFTTGGESSQWWRGMGVAVIFGLAFATFLTLVLVPVLYDYLLQLREWWSARRGRGEGEPFGGDEEDEEERREREGYEGEEPLVAARSHR
jgi:multidrug efflux pump